MQTPGERGELTRKPTGPVSVVHPPDRFEAPSVIRQMLLPTERIKGGVLNRKGEPVGNTTMASATLKQGYIGSLLGFGTVVSPDVLIRDV